MMNAAEIKLDMFRRIDNLSQTDLKKFYSKFIDLINASSTYKLSQDERIAIEDALHESEKGNIHSHNDVIAEAKQKYPNLKFE